MVSTNRWNSNHSEFPPFTGTLKEIRKFDCGAFGIHPRQADIMEPTTRILLEVAYEALYDAGVNPCELEGTKTGVFISNLSSNSLDPMVKHDVKPPREAYSEMHRFTSANLISYTLKVNGPSCTLDSGCSASLHTFEHAYRAIRNGEIDAAIVGGAVINLNPAMTIQGMREGYLSREGHCKVFDEKADGYVKAEAVAAIFLQKRSNARRIYCEAKHCKTSNDGFTEAGITVPSAAEQALLFSQVYQECSLNPDDVYYVEAHGTGTKVGDVEEANAIDNALIKDRTDPLLVGSVKSNMGHAELASGLCQIAKVVIAMENGFIPPNLHHQEDRRNIDSLQEGRLKVVTGMERLVHNALFAINSMGFGGSNAHVVLKAHTIAKRERENESERLLCVSGRTNCAVREILESITSRSLDVELIALLNDLYKWQTPLHRYKGTLILSRSHEEMHSAICKCTISKSNLCLIFGDFSNRLLEIGRQVLVLPLGFQIYEKVSEVLQCDFAKLLIESKNCMKPSSLAALIQTVIVCLLKVLDVNNIEVVNASSSGTLIDSYSKGEITFEEAIRLAAFAIEDDKEYVRRFLQVKPHKSSVSFVFGRVNENFQEENNFLMALSK